MAESRTHALLRSLIGIATVTLFVVLAAAPANAASAGRVAPQATVHVVQAGENLFRIALRYGTTVEALQAANNLAGTSIYVGQRLVIPGAASAPAGAPASGGAVHVVQPGDTLSGIALRYGVTTAALMAANNISSPNLITVGQRLTIPGGGGAPAGAPSGGGTYTVLPGDTLSRIARLHGTTVAALASLNGLSNPSAIYVGQVLRVSGTAPAGTAGGTKRIIVDLSEQHLYAYQGDTLVYSFVASSGRAPTTTRTGEFRVQSKFPRAYGSAWNIWMPYWLGIYWAGSLENGIHALPVLPNGQTLWAGYLGTPISFGCIVLGTYEAQLLYNWAEIGTPVSIRW